MKEKKKKEFLVLKKRYNLMENNFLLNLLNYLIN